MKKTLILAAAFACAAFTANANVIVATWGVDAFTTAFNQDAADANSFAQTGNIAADNGSAAILHIATKKGVFADGAVGSGQNGYFYSGGFGAPNNLQFQSGSVTSSLQTIILEVSGAGMPVSTAPTLNFGADHIGVVATTFDKVTSTETVDSPMGPQILSTYTYTWDVSAYANVSDFTVNFPLVLHNALFEVSLTAVSAVPEPSTYALIAGAFGLAAVVVARRRRA